jgi:rhodanese-related sulfurtransferase
MDLPTISPQQLQARQRSGAALELIDVRTPVEFREVHLAGAQNIPLDQLDPRALMEARSGASDEPLYVICRSGGRGAQACAQFHAQGFAQVVNVEGGTLACEQAGLPVTRGQATMALERQVRIAAGTLVLLGAVLAWLVHPGLIALSALVGAGLIFSGVTDTCGMGLLLARMPWNRCAR